MQLIENPKVLTSEYLPNELLHRHGQREEIARGIEPLLTENGLPRNILIHGPPGSGKTAMTRKVLQELKERMFLQDMQVNCFSAKTRFDILYELLDKKLSVPRAGTSTEEVKQKLDDKIKSQPSLIVIDEVDQIQSGEILYDLSRYTETPVLMTANTPQVFAYFDDRIASRMADTKKIKFPQYSNSKLVDILQRRVEKGLRDDAVSHKILSLIAESSEGDSRKAILSLKHAVQDSQARGHEKVREKVAREAVKDAAEQHKKKSSSRLNQHQKTLRKILKEDGSMTMGNLYTKYQEKVDDAKSKRTVRRYLNKMESYGLIQSRGRNNGKTYFC